MASYFNQRVLHDIFQDVILPWANSGELLLTVAEPGWPTPEGVTVVPQKNALRTSTRIQPPSQRNQPWISLGLHCRPNPLMLFVLEGEADIRIGRSVEIEKAASGTRKRSRNYEVSVYSLPARSCFIVPPDVAHSDGSTPHWERPFPEKARSQILWLQILTTGAMVHVCQTDGLSHTHNSSLFIRDQQISMLMQFFLERAGRPQPSLQLLSSFMFTLLLCFDNSQAATQLPDEAIRALPEEAREGRSAPRMADDMQSEAFDRACLFVASHLSDAISPGQIARQIHISVSQLNRIFHSRLGMPVMKYVTQCRMEEAKALLLRTSLSTQEIAEICGYPYRTHFSRAFKAHWGESPNIYRQRARQGAEVRS